MQTPRQRRLELLARENHGRKIRPALLARLSSTLGISLKEDNCTSLDNADRIVNDLQRGEEPSRLIHLSLDGLSSVAAIAACMCERLWQTQCLLQLSDWERCGLIRVPAGTAFSNWQGIIEIDGNALTLLSHDGQNRVYIDFTPDDPDWTFAIEVKGSEWLALLQDCLPCEE